MNRPFYRPLAFGEGSLIGDALVATRIFGGDAISVHIEARDSTQPQSSVVSVQLFDPLATKPPEEMRPLLEDLQAARSISHPCLISIRHISKTQKDELFLVYPSHHLGSLELELEQSAETGLSVDECVRILLGIAHALRAAKEKSLFHGHLTPADVLLDEHGAVIVRGLGLSVIYHGPLGKDRSDYGRSYASPEQLQGERGSHASDLYSLGVIAYEMLTGSHPRSFSGEAQRLSNIGKEDPIYWLASIVDELMSKDASDRKTNIDALIALLERHSPEDEAARSAAYMTAKAARMSPPPALGGLPLLSLSQTTKLVWIGIVLVVFVVVAELGLQNRRRFGELLSLPKVAKQNIDAAEATISGELVIDEENGRKRYVDTEVGYTLSTPVGWNIDPNPQIVGSRATFFAPDSPEPRESPELSVSVKNMKKNETLAQHEQDYIRAFKSTFEANNPQYLSSEGDVQIRKYVARELRLQASHGGTPVVFHTFTFVCEEPRSAIAITFRYAIETDQAFRNHHRDILQSFDCLNKSERDQLLRESAATVDETQKKINQMVTK